MKEYDFCVLFHPDLEMNIDPALNKVKKIIESNDGKILKEESEGKKRLAYIITSGYLFRPSLRPKSPVP